MNEEEEEFDFEEWEGEEFVHPKLYPIHKTFYPFDSEEPFQECTMCKTDLMICENYMIEKAIKGSDVLFEIAMCVPCALKMQKKMSVESIANMERFMKNVDFEERLMDNADKEEFYIEEYLSHCLISGKEIPPGAEHQIYAHCSMDQMYVGVFPYAISGEKLDEMQEQLSAQTKQEMDDFMDQYLIPDDLRDLLKGRPVLL